ncbi:MAG TPA: prephenate dehydratase domain-containing protein [Polyangiaceae bacterium]|jgi:chorismate mutase/prephenate dehydratase|nr:prephenate dehydratase domain-containing protein [Polyangiaceae bacterium]
MTDRRRELEDLRRQMAEADADILLGLRRRARLARRVGELGQPPSSTAAMEREQLAMLEQMAGDELPLEVMRSVFREIHAATSSLERPARVVYVGPEGGFCHLAAQLHFGAGATFAVVEWPEIAIDEVRRRRADFAVFPFESSMEGPLPASVGALSASELSLSAKIEVAARLSLMSKTGVATEIQKVYAHATDRAASQKCLAELPDAVVVDARSPMQACQMCLEEPGGAAIVPQATGERAGLVVVQLDVSDRADLRVRYGLASTRPSQRSGSDTTGLLFALHDEPGALFDVLKHFAERGINLKTIQTQPMAGESWNRLFYVEVSGHVTDRAVITALDEIKRQTKLLKVLGSFPSC